jgi:hypothetical protein
LGPDDEVANEGASTEGGAGETASETEAEKPEAEEDEDGFVSSKDMFDEM